MTKKAEIIINIISPESEREEFRFKIPCEILAGRDSRCSITLNDKKVSRKHFEIVCKDANKIIVRDLGSTNGTYVNNKKIKIGK